MDYEKRGQCSMKIVAFIPIKLNNERIPGKNTKKFSDGTALITFFLKTIIEVTEIDELYVFCSNSDIEQYFVPGVKYLKRPTFLDTKQATPQDIIEEFMKRVDADIYMMAHCTSPFVTKEHLEECISVVKNEKYDSSFTGEKIRKLLWDNAGNSMNFNPSQIPRTQDLPLIYAEVSAAYVFRKEVFYKFRRRIGFNPYITEVSGIECIDIDYPEDFEIADAIYMNIIKK